MIRTIEECVKNGLLEEVKMHVPSAAVFAIGDRAKQAAMGRELHPWTCEPNSIHLVKGMLDAGESDWEVVGGFAFFCQALQTGEGNLIEDLEHGLRRHVWAKKSGMHFDPTWSRFGSTIQDIKQNRYYALTEQSLVQNRTSEESILDRLDQIAEGWGLRVE